MTTIKKWTVKEPYLQLDGGLLEAPFHEKDSHQLRLVDIVKQKLHVIDLNKGPSSHKAYDLEVAVGVTADIDGSQDDIIVGAKHGFAVLNRKTGKHVYIKKLWDEKDGPGKEERCVFARIQYNPPLSWSLKARRMRLNDGAVDSEGRFWAGAMNDPLVTEPTNEGVLFRLDPDLKLQRIIEKVTIPNGIGWNVNNDTMFFTDSPTKNIYKFDYDAATGGIVDRRVFFHLDEEDVVPDGFAIDVEDHLWTAVFGGWKVLRVSPDGKVVGEISLPTRCISCPSFVGEELFIATAAEEAPEQYPESRKFAGSLFRVNVGVQGLPVNRFRTSQNLKLPKAVAS
ncbi:MAG: hypothetical protein M1830_004857 [Pleopsidium flavum]|nr:MAG: hypothetical protein M1830_004857 [Pleopsidium flavum]